MMPPSPQRKHVTRLISLFIVTILLLQAHVTILFLPRDRFSFSESIRPPRLWPFVDYPMYSHAHYKGDLITTRHVVGVFEDGTEREIKSQDVNLSGWHFGLMSNALQSNDRDRIESLVDLIERQLAGTLKSLRLEERSLRFDGSGVETGPTKTIAAVSLENR